MLNRFFGPSTHHYLHLLGLSGLAVGIPTNKVVMSISMMFLLLNLLLLGEFRNYFRNWKSSPIFLLAFGLYLLHIVALIWSEDLVYGFNDLRVKLPLLVVPLAVIAYPVAKREFQFILILFTATVLITSMVNFGAYIQLFGEMNFDDIRGMSLFGSHTRFGLLVAFGAGVSLYYIYILKEYRFIFASVFVWFLFYTYYSQVLSGFLALSGVLFVFVLYALFKWQKWVGIAAAIILPGLALLAVVNLLVPIHFDMNAYANLPKVTEEGHTYLHAPHAISPETGKPIEIYICEEELKREWDKVSNLPFEGLDMKGQSLRWTLIRYMSSMDLTKDAKGFRSLSKEDIRKIEKGIASQYSSGLMARYYGIKFQLNNTEDPNEHSLLKRFEYWKTGMQIARKNLMLGVGTGDVQLAFNKAYSENYSLLHEENRVRTHNYFLTILITFGIPGLFLFFWLHSEFLLSAIRSQQVLGIAFITIILLSYLTEDTLETQTGITFFSFFLGLFDNDQRSPES